MMRKPYTIAIPVALALVAGSCGPSPVGFTTDVKPILDRHCAECHLQGGDGTKASGFQVDDHRAVMAGTRFGPVVVPGDPLSSSLYRLVAGKVDPSIKMPHGREQLSDGEVQAIKDWIAQGAKEN
jgi:hypothetical protein